MTRCAVVGCYGAASHDSFGPDDGWHLSINGTSFRETCQHSGRDWAGRYQHCTLTPAHRGRCIGSTGAPIDRKGRGY